MRDSALFGVLAGLLFAASGGAGELSAVRPGATRLGVKDGAFLLNGAPTFLLGVSYYGGLAASEETLAGDLKAFREHGVNWIRVWATWAAFENDLSAVDAEGAPRPAYMDKLVQVVAACDRSGLVVDVTLSRQNGATGPPRLRTTAALIRAAREIAAALAPYPNWYLDAANERNIRDARFVSLAEIAQVVRAVKTLQPARLVTASHAGGDLALDEIPAYLEAGVDFLAPHRPRHKGSAAETGAWTRAAIARMRGAGRLVPVHFQEPFRRGYGRKEDEPVAADFITDLTQALEAGAAGWCLHNGETRGTPAGRPRRSFDLRDGPLMAQLDEEELKVLAYCKAHFAKERN